MKIKHAFLTAVLGGLLIVPAALAQNGGQAGKSPSVGGFFTEAEDWTFNEKTARFVGRARIKSPQLDLSSDVIGLDYEKFQVTEVRARGNVKMRLDLVPKGGGPASRIETTAKSATLKVGTRTLVLEGNVSGFYQLPGGSKNTLSGSRAVLTYGADKNLTAELEGGVKLVLPAENSALPTAIGTVTITSQKASVDSVSGEGRFTGNARAVSSDATNKFDVSAPAFVLTRSAAGTIDTLKTTGRTNLKIDFPPTTAAVAAPAAGATAEKPGALQKVGKPTHMEVSADSAIVRRSDNTLVLEGNVRGFYELTRDDGTVGRQQFSGEKATVKFVQAAQANAETPEGVQIQISGKPVSIELPQFDLGF